MSRSPSLMAMSRGIERVLGREQPLLVLVLLAEHARAVGQVVELLLDLRLDQRALFLHHQNDIESFGELENALGSSGQVMPTL